MDMNKTLYEFKFGVEESFDKFVFETISPFCDRITQTKIEKEFLEKALINYNGVKTNSEIICPRCKQLLYIPLEKIKGRKEVYCWNCGIKIIRYYGGIE